MQIQFIFTCRSCGHIQNATTDTSKYGFLEYPDPDFHPEIQDVSRALLLELRCSQCDHVSGELGLGYRYREEHRPPHEDAWHAPI